MRMLDDERIYITKRKTVLNREQKTSLSMVIGFGALAFVFGLFFMWKHVASPFVLTYTGPKFLTGDQKDQAAKDALRKEDTDSDGLNDYDELYVYRTSPYLSDSDSDGMADKTEITKGLDPNCAPTMPCASAVVDAVNPDSLQGNFAEEPSAPVAPSASPVDVAQILAQMTTEQLRAALIDAGGDAAVVNALTDEDMRTAMMQAIAATTPAPSSDASTPTPSPSDQPQP